MIEMKDLDFIYREPVIVKFSDKAAEAYNAMMARGIPKDGIRDDDDAGFNLCPVCGRAFIKESNYCSNCGQRVSFVESDLLPL